MAEESIWDSKGIYDDGYEDELIDEDVVINPIDPVNDDVPTDDEDDEWYDDLMNPEAPDPALEEARRNPSLSSWIPSMPVKASPVTDNARYAYNYFNKLGLPAHVSAGIVGNLMKESGVNPNTRDGDKRGGIGGIAQWDPQRSQNLRAFAQQNGKNPTSLDAQLDFVYHEARQRGDLDKAMKTQTPEEATVVFGRAYERPNEKYADWNTRQAYAKGLQAKAYGGPVNDIPEYEGIGPEVYDEYEQLQLQDNGENNNAADTGDGEDPRVGRVNAAFGAIHKGIDAFDAGKSKLSRIADTVSRSTMDAIEFQNEVAGAARNARSLRNYSKTKNTKKFAPVRTVQNQPLIYS